MNFFGFKRVQFHDPHKMQDEAYEMKKYYDNLQKAYKRAKKKLDSSPNDPNYNVIAEIQQIQLRIKEFQMQFGNFIKAQKNNFGEFNEDMYRSYINSRKPMQDFPQMHPPYTHPQIYSQTPHNKQVQHEEHQMLPEELENFDYATHENQVAHLNQYHAHFQSGLPRSLSKNTSPPFQGQRMQSRTTMTGHIAPPGIFYQQFSMGDPNRNINIQQQQNYQKQDKKTTKNVISPPMTQQHQKIMEKRGSPQNLPAFQQQKDINQESRIIKQKTPQIQTRRQVESPSGSEYRNTSRKSPNHSQLRQHGKFTEIYVEQGAITPKNQISSDDKDPSVLFSEKLKLNVTEICEKAKKAAILDSKNDLEIYKKKWKLNNLKLTPEVQDQIFEDLNDFITSMLNISTSLAKNTEHKQLERKHVEFAFYKIEKKPMPDSSYIPQNHMPSKKHIKRMNLLNNSKDVK